MAKPVSAHEVMDANYRSRGGKKSLRSITLSHAENGGHIAEHRYESAGQYHEPEMHVFGKGEGKKLMAHIAEHMKIEHEPKAEAEQEETAAGAAY